MLRIAWPATARAAYIIRKQPIFQAQRRSFFSGVVHGIITPPSIGKLALLGDDPATLEQYLSGAYLQVWREIARQAFER
jgi:hypothetical protein